MSKIKELQMKISECHAKIKRIQDDCSHPEDCVTKKYGGSSGNYDPTCDEYWIDFHCDLCDKRWRTEQQ